MLVGKAHVVLVKSVSMLVHAAVLEQGMVPLKRSWWRENVVEVNAADSAKCS